MAQNRQKSAVFEKSGLAQAGAEAAAIAAQRRAKKAFSVPAPVPLDSRPSEATSTDKSLPRPSTPPIPAPRRKNIHSSVHQPEPSGKKPQPLPRTVVKSESSSQMPQSRPKVLRSSLILPRAQSQIVVPKQPPPPIAPKPVLHSRQLKQKPEEDESNRQIRRSSTLPQSWKVERQSYGSEVESDTKDTECGTSTATEDNHQHGMVVMISLYNYGALAY